MRTFINNTKAQYTLIIAFILNCIFSVICQRQVCIINGTNNTSLADILTFQFNLYSYTYLFFLPVFIYASYRYLKTSKFNEFTITRYESRVKYFLCREKNAFLFSCIYRIAEILISGLIFIASYLLNSINNLHVFSLSVPMQKILCIMPQTSKEVFIIFIYVQLNMILLYYFFTQIIILSDFNLKNPVFSVSVPIIVNFLFLILVKSNYWFEGNPIRYLLPHSNTFLEYIFNRMRSNYSLGQIWYTLIYWVCIIAILNLVVFLKTKSKDFIYPTENIDREAE